jgi:alpha-L-rhamnosidase
MMRYLEYISKKAKDDGTYELGLGDWLPVRKKTDAAPLSIASTLTVMDIAKKACVMFEAVGLTLQASFANALYERTRSAFREVLIDKSDYTVFGAVQSAQALALYYGAFDEGEYAAAYRRLIELIREDGNSLSGGFLGLRVVFHVLAANGDAELAYNMICKKEYPSYGYLVNPALDFTTMPESLSEEFVTPELLETKENGSMNHHFFGDIAHFFVRHVVGINIDADRIVIKPNFIKSLDFAEASYKLHDGETLCVKWHREGENVIVTVLGASHVFEAPSEYKISDKSLTSYTLTK